MCQMPTIESQPRLRDKVFTIRTCRIISAFENEIDEEKLAEYTAIMQIYMLSHDFPPIMGYPSVIDRQMVEDGIEFLDGEIVTENMLGEAVWFVTDGHHRTISAIAAHVPTMDCTLDYNCLTSERDLGLW